MVLGWIRVALIALLIGCFEVAVRPFVPWLVFFYPLLPVLVLTLLGSRFSRAVVLGTIGGLFLDLFFLDQLDYAVLRFPVVVCILAYVSGKWLTNRSLYTALALTIFGRVIERIFAWCIALIIRGTGEGVWHGIAPVFSFDLLTVTVGFIILAVWTSRFLTAIPRAAIRESSWYES